MEYFLVKYHVICTVEILQLNGINKRKLVLLHM